MILLNSIRITEGCSAITDYFKLRRKLQWVPYFLITENFFCFRMAFQQEKNTRTDGSRKRPLVSSSDFWSQKAKEIVSRTRGN